MKAIIFDLDGVICHTDKYHYLAWKALADELKIDFDEKVNNRLRGVSRMESLDIILEKYDGYLSGDVKELLANKKNDLYREYLVKMSTKDLTDEVFNTLEELKRRGYRLAIGSSSKNAPLILERIGLGNYFEVISDGNNIINSKPNPEVFLKAAEMLSLPPEECYVVEDALAGIDAAKRANMIAIAISDARSSAIADYRIESFADLLLIAK